MHAFLIIGEEEDYIKNIDGKKIEFPFAKISDVRDLNNFTKLKLTEKTAIILRDFDKGSEEAQNAFLKSLEEPQENLIYILTAQNLEKILPTIVSRSEVIRSSREKGEINDIEKEKAKLFINLNIGEKLRIISQITKRNEAINFVDNLITVGHELFLENPNLVTFLDNANKLKKYLDMNGNIQLQLTNFIINTA